MSARLSAEAAALVRRQHDLEADGWHEAAAKVRSELAALDPEAARLCLVAGSTVVREAFERIRVIQKDSDSP